MLDGHAWAIAEVPSVLPVKPSVPVSGIDYVCDPLAIVTQHRDPPRQFVFLSTQVFYSYFKYNLNENYITTFKAKLMHS